MSGRLILASASPRRAELLRQIGLRFDIQSTQIDESWQKHEQPLAHATRLAREKALAVAGEKSAQDSWVLGADTIVVAKGQVLGKPSNRTDAKRMLGMLAGHCHQVISAVALFRGAPKPRVVGEAQQTSEVCFGPLSDSEIEAYVATGECDDKAGAYAIQGRAAAFITSLRGSYSGVMGLPLYETCQLLRREPAQFKALVEVA